METDFRALREYLEVAWLQARGDDATSRKVRDALDMLIEGILHAEHYRPGREANVLNFPKSDSGGAPNGCTRDRLDVVPDRRR